MTQLAKAHALQPPPLKGMETINRYWDRMHLAWAAKIAPGELYVTTCGELVVTVLGSCVSACIRDCITGVGGMNHFMLPEEMQHSSHRFDSLKTRYGTWAMERLINEILKNGGSRENLEVKVFGGSAVVDHMTNDIGDRNINFAFEYLAREKLSIKVSDVGGMYARKVAFNPMTGLCRVKAIQRTNHTVRGREDAYAKRLLSDTDGSIELF